MKTLYFFIGTQAELMKLFTTIQKAKEANYTCVIISTGQNDLSGSLFLTLANASVDIDIAKKKAEHKNTQGYLGMVFSNHV